MSHAWHETLTTLILLTTSSPYSFSQEKGVRRLEARQEAKDAHHPEDHQEVISFRQWIGLQEAFLHFEGFSMLSMRSLWYSTLSA